MNKINHNKNIQCQIANLIPVLRSCLSLQKEIEQTKSKLNILPDRLEYLEEQLKKLQLESSQKTNNWQSKIQKTESKLDFIVDDLEAIFNSITTLDRHLKNTVALQERFEAIQEERINHLTPERINKILRKENQSLDFFDDELLSNKTNIFKETFQKIASYRYSKKIAKTIVITVVTLLGLGTISYSLINYSQTIENNTIEETQKSSDISAKS